MADGIIDPSVIEAEQTIEQRKFLSRLAPVATGLLAGAVLGPAAGIALGLAQRRSTLLDLEAAEDSRDYAISEYTQRMRRAGTSLERARTGIERYAQLPGIGESQVASLRDELTGLYERSMSFDPAVASEAQRSLDLFATQLKAQEQGMDSEALTMQRSMIQEDISGLRDEWNRINEDQALMTSNIEEGLNLINNNDPNNPNIRGRLLRLLSSGIDTAPTMADAISTLPIIGGLIGGFVKADEIEMSPDEWRNLFLTAQQSVSGTGAQLRGAIEQGAQELDPLARNLKVLPGQITTLDYVTSNDIEFEDAPMPRRINAPSNAPSNTNNEDGEVIINPLDGRPVRTTPGEGNVFTRLMDYFSGDNDINARQQADQQKIERIKSRLPAGSKIVFNDAGEPMAQDANGDVRAMQLTAAERALLMVERSRMQAENRSRAQ